MPRTKTAPVDAFKGSHPGRTRHETGRPNDDAAQLAREMADVIPLAPDPRGRVRITATPRLPRERTSPLSVSSEPSGAVGPAVEFAANGVDRRELRKLKRGDHTPGARLDLHGMTVDEAAGSVRRFLDANCGRQRCVCIVHGQGRHSGGNVSVLKPRVRDWLRRHPGVLAYADAPRTDGGAGAVYVLLRR